MGKKKQKILKQRNKTDSKEKKRKKQVQMLGHVIHDHTLHKTLHQIYIFLFETGTQSEEVRTPDKSFRKTFGEKEGNIRTRSEFAKKISIELDLKPFA